MSRVKKRGSHNRNKENKIKELKKEEPKYYISLDDGNFFPGWLTKWKDGYVQLPISKRKGYMSISAYKNGGQEKQAVSHLEGIAEKNLCDDVVVFDYKDECIGQDINYLYNLSEVIVTPTITNDNNFIIVLVIKPKVKPSKRKIITTTYKQMYLEYQILCPIWQDN